MNGWIEWFGDGRLVDIVAALIRTAVIAGLAWIALRGIARAVEHGRRNWLRLSLGATRRRLSVAGTTPETAIEEMEKRSHTIAHLIRHALSGLVMAVALITIAQQAGLDIRALLGAAGIVSLAVGFGARSLVQDIVSGLFLLGEGQIREGDVVRLDQISGRVEEINLRHVRLRSGDGIVHIVPNGTVRMVSNLTQQFSYYVWDLRLSDRTDLDAIAGLLQQTGHELRADPEFGGAILEDLEILGMDGFHANGPLLKMRIKTAPNRQWAVGREMNRRIKRCFDAKGVPFPLPAHRVYGGAARDATDTAREALKQQVRAMLSRDDHGVELRNL